MIILRGKRCREAGAQSCVVHMLRTLRLQSEERDHDIIQVDKQYAIKLI